MPAIRVAIKTHKRPTAVILRDDWYGHRDPFTGEPRGDKDEWLDWDYALIDAAQTIEDYSDQYGLLQWELDDEDSVVDAVKKIHPFEEARDLATRGENYKPAPGEYFLPEVYRYGGGELQSYTDWLEQQARKGAEED
jgi:hypothetical protein